MSIGAGLVEESKQKCHFYNWNVHVKDSNWFNFLRHLTIYPTGQVQAATIMSSNKFYNNIITFFSLKVYFRMNINK